MAIYNEELPDSLVDHDNVMEWFSREYRAYPGKRCGSKAESIARFVENWMTPQPGLKLLDYGCGNGAIFGIWHRFGFDVIGMDPCFVAVDAARSNRFGFEVIQNDGQTIPLEDGSQDVIACLAVLHHTPLVTQVALEKEFWRVLRAGGRVFRVDALGRHEIRRRHGMVIPERHRSAEFYEDLFRRWQRVDKPKNGWRGWSLYRKGTE